MVTHVRSEHGDHCNPAHSEDHTDYLQKRDLLPQERDRDDEDSYGGRLVDGSVGRDAVQHNQDHHAFIKVYSGPSGKGVCTLGGSPQDDYYPLRRQFLLIYNVPCRSPRRGQMVNGMTGPNIWRPPHYILCMDIPGLCERDIPESSTQITNKGQNTTRNGQDPEYNIQHYIR